MISLNETLDNAANNKKWWVLATICLLTVILNFDLTGVNLAIPKIAHQMHASLANMQWVLNAYVLTSGMFTIFGGQLGDKIGQRKTYILGTFIFTAASLAAGLATNEFILIASRAIQGFALGIAYPMTIVLAFKSFSKEQQGLVMGFIVGTMGLSMAIGPTLGGTIVHYLNWRWIFLINLPIGIITIALTLLFCAADSPSKVRKKFDYLGFLLLIFGIFFVILAINEISEWGISSVSFITTLLIGSILLLLLFLFEQRISNPVINFRFFKIADYAIHCWLRFVAQIIMTTVLFFIPIYLQNILDYKAINAGYMLLMFTAILGISSPFIGRLVDTFGTKLPSLAAMIFYTAACLLLYQLRYKHNFYILNSALLLSGLATSIIFVCSNAGILIAVAEKRSSMASGIFFTIAWISNAIGLAITGAVFADVSTIHLLTALNQQHIVLAMNQQAELERIAHGVSPISTLSNYVLPQQVANLKMLITASFMHGFAAAMMVLLLCAIIGAMSTCLIKR